MELAIAFILFIICVAVSLILDISMLAPLLVGFVLFTALAAKNGFALKTVLKMAVGSLKESFIVVGILLLIGCLTGLWRSSGTVAYFVTLGVSVMPPSFFLLAAFLLSAAMSFAIGTSFGVTATAGVIIMSIAHAGGISPIPVAGAVLSGVYVGDRGSPASSAANLVAAVTGTDVEKNIKIMLKSGAVPFLLCCAIYGVLSVFYPMQSTDSQVLLQLGEEFRLSWLCLIPAILMIVLPFCKVKVKWAMAIDIVVSFVLAMITQGAGFADCFKTMLLGFEPQNTALSTMLSGGGVMSMLEVCGILLLSGTYGGIFHGTGMLDSLSDKLIILKSKVGRFPVMVLLSFAVSIVFCNQTIGVIMLSQLSEGLYGTEDAERYSKMIDIENSVIVIAGLVPWCIACSVPLAMMNVGAAAVPMAFYLWLIPLCTAIAYKRNNRSITEV